MIGLGNHQRLPPAAELHQPRPLQRLEGPLRRAVGHAKAPGDLLYGGEPLAVVEKTKLDLSREAAVYRLFLTVD